MTEQTTRDLPTSEQLLHELLRVRYGRDRSKTLRALLHVLLVLCAIAVLVSLLCAPVLHISDTGMSPVLQRDDLVLCSRWSTVGRGDIIAFRFNDKILVKRVIGMAGDTVDIGADGTVRVNGTPLDEPYVSELTLGACDISFPYQIPETRLFVLGDSRAASVDSRSTAIGCIPEEQVLGTVVLRIFPFSRFSTL